MIRAVIFDVDGVIFESADIKTEAFRELFSGYPEKVEDIVTYHITNAGISRYVKFQHIYENMLNLKLAEDKDKELGERFSEIVFEKVKEAPFVAGVKEFLEANKDRYKFFIVSGTPDQELHKVISARALKSYFTEIHGSPKEKKDIINNIMKDYGFDRKEVVYIGDAESDRIAALETEVFFIMRDTNLILGRKGVLCVVKDLTGIGKILEKLNSEIDNSILTSKNFNMRGD